jgi:hypothetical protein
MGERIVSHRGECRSGVHPSSKTRGQWNNSPGRRRLRLCRHPGAAPRCPLRQHLAGRLPWEWPISPTRAVMPQIPPSHGRHEWHCQQCVALMLRRLRRLPPASVAWHRHATTGARAVPERSAPSCWPNTPQVCGLHMARQHSQRSLAAAPLGRVTLRMAMHTLQGVARGWCHCGGPAPQWARQCGGDGRATARRFSGIVPHAFGRPLGAAGMGTLDRDTQRSMTTPAAPPASRFPVSAGSWRSVRAVPRACVHALTPGAGRQRPAPSGILSTEPLRADRDGLSGHMRP